MIPHRVADMASERAVFTVASDRKDLLHSKRGAFTDFGAWNGSFHDLRSNAVYLYTDNWFKSDMIYNEKRASKRKSRLRNYL
jgi:hypothetical protein